MESQEGEWEESDGEQGEEWGTPRGSQELREAKRRGRPTKAESWVRERSSSDGSLLDSFRESFRKRKAEGGDIERSLKKSNLVGEEKKKKEEVMDEEGEVAAGGGAGGVEARWVELISQKLAEAMTGVAQELRRMKEEMGEGRREMREEQNEMKREIEETKRKGEEERRRLKARIEKLEEENRRRETEEAARKEEEGKEAEERLRKIVKEAREKEEREGREKERRMKELEREWERKENQERRNNFILRGEEIEGEVTAEQVVGKVLEHLTGRKEGVKEIAEIGGIKRAIMVRMMSWADKRRVTTERSRLRGRKIYIDEDLTKKEREVQSELWERAKEERGRGQRVSVGYKKLRIGDTTWEWKEERGGLVQVDHSRGESGRGRGRGRGGRAS